MKARDPRVRQAAAGIAILFAASLLFLGFQFGRLLPGLAGEWFAKMGGLLTTPFFMEFTLGALGLVLVLTINHWRQKREGDEFVYLEEIRDSPPGMPEQARWAIYAEKPLDAVPLTVEDRLEGALDIGDTDGALEILAAMDEEDRKSPGIVRLRIRLARQTAREDLAERLEAELAAGSEPESEG